MKKLHKVSLILILTCSMLSSAENTSGSSLLQDLGARGAGLAGSGTSLSGDVTFLKYNPAAIALMKNPQLSVFYYNGGELGTNFGAITYGQKFGPGVIALGLSYFNGGQMDLNFLGGGSAAVISQQDVIGGLSYALEPSKGIEIGISAKVFASTLMGSLNAQTVCGDAGVQFKNVLVENLNAGAALLNLGNGIKYLNTSELLPTNLAAGVSYSIAVDKMLLLAAVDGTANLNESKNYITIGAEVSYENYTLRAGLPLFSDMDTVFAVGLGFKMNQYTFDYSVTIGKILASAHKISVSMLFGEVEVKEETITKQENTVMDKGPSEYKKPVLTPKKPVPEKKPKVLKKEIK